MEYKNNLNGVTYKRYTREELDKIIRDHLHWLEHDCKGWTDMRADLTNADLTDMCLDDVNLQDACLHGALLTRSSLTRADLSFADLEYADIHSSSFYHANLHRACLRGVRFQHTSLNYADISEADLRYTSLVNADLRFANLHAANLKGANLAFADFENAILANALFDDNEKYRLGEILKTPMTGYKRTREGTVITVSIPAGAIVYCVNGDKCRTDKARIIDMAGEKVLHSIYDASFEYRLKQYIEIEDFDLAYNAVCTRGFHFFRTFEEAYNYIH